MRMELDDYLCRRHPDLFRDRHGDPQETGMCWGFSCGDGWFALIEALCSEITRHAHSTMLDVVATGVKEKWGTLRFRHRGGDDYIKRLVQTAEHLSESICEECGAFVSHHRTRTNVRGLGDRYPAHRLCGDGPLTAPEYEILKPTADGLHKCSPTADLRLTQIEIGSLLRQLSR